MAKCYICDHDDENYHLALDMEHYDNYNKVNDDGICFRCWKIIQENRDSYEEIDKQFGEVEHTIEGDNE